jgi:hypothetical protein
MVILMGEEPDDHFALEQLMGKQCRIYLQKKTKGDKVYYSVNDVAPGTG